MNLSIEAIRSRQLDQLKFAVPIYHTILGSLSPDEIITKRDGGDGWTVLEVMCHLRDYERLIIERATVTLNQDNPPMPGMNPAALAIEKAYNEQDLATVVEEWANSRAEYLTLQGNTTEAQWSRISTHATRGALTLTDQLILTVWHDMNHLEQLTKIINGV